MMTRNASLALFWLQFRLLRQNRAAWAVLAMLLLGGMLLSQYEEAEAEPVCYIVYWQEDDLVRHLRCAAPPTSGPPIQLAHVREFTDDDNLIVYPHGAHSIQIRPPASSQQPWRIWYWHCGDDPGVLQPVFEWFWARTRERFPHDPSWEVFASALEPTHPLTRSVRKHSSQLLHGRHAKPALVLICLFFCGGYLPMLFLAEQTDSRVLDTLITKPVGFLGWGRNVLFFHFALACAVVAPLVIAFQWSNMTRLLTVGIGLTAYLGLAFALGCGCRRVSTAGTALVLYGALSALLLGYSLWQGELDGTLCLEWRLVSELGNQTASLAGLGVCVAWAACWGSFGWLGFRQLTKS